MRPLSLAHGATAPLRQVKGQNDQFLVSPGLRIRTMSVVTNLGNSGNTASFSTVGTLTSGTGADLIVFTGAVTNASVDLGGGSDALTLGNFANSATVANTEPSPAAPAPTSWC
jgi:hypothetical protein